MVIRNKSWADAQLEWRAESVSRNGTLVTVALGSSTVPYQVSTPGTPFSPLDGSAAFISPLLETHTPKPQRQTVWTEITPSHNKDHQGCHTDGLRAEWVPHAFGCVLWGRGVGMCFPVCYKSHHDRHLVPDLFTHFFDPHGPPWPLSSQS